MPFKGLQLIAQFNFQRATGCINTRKFPARPSLQGDKKAQCRLILQFGIWDTFALNANRLYFIHTDCQQIIFVNQSLVPFQKNVMKMRDFFPQRKSYFNFFHLILTKPDHRKRHPRNLMMQHRLWLELVASDYAFYVSFATICLICE